MRNFFCIFFLFTWASSCNFLEEQSQDLAYAQSCADLDEILIGSGYMKHGNGSSFKTDVNGQYMPWLHVMDDDVDNFTWQEYSNIQSAPFWEFGGFYMWSQDPFLYNKSRHRDDWDWERFYTHVNSLNVIIDKVDDFTGDKEETRKRVKGEAQFLRAGYYFLLANIYALPFEQGKDLPGIPLKLSGFVDKGYFSRAPLESVYSQIVKDLKDACSNLTGIPTKSIYRANEVAARLLLSRVYLFMGEWELALNECKTIETVGGYSLLDLSGKANEDFLNENSPEVIFSQGTYNLALLCCYPDYYANSSFCASEDLLKCYDQTNDRRYHSFFKRTADGLYLLPRKTQYYQVSDYTKWKISDIFIMRYAEVLLNKAEALAMLDRDGEAISTLNLLMEKRYVVGTMPSVNESGKNLVNYIRDERRRELCFEGHRWFDLRRYAVSPKYPDPKGVFHEEKANNNVIASYYLKPYPEGKNWVLPIPTYELEFNKETMIDNERENVERN